MLEWNTNFTNLTLNNRFFSYCSHLMVILSIYVLEGSFYFIFFLQGRLGEIGLGVLSLSAGGNAKESEEDMNGLGFYQHT